MLAKPGAANYSGEGKRWFFAFPVFRHPAVNLLQSREIKKHKHISLINPKPQNTKMESGWRAVHDLAEGRQVKAKCQESRHRQKKLTHPSLKDRKKAGWNDRVVRCAAVRCGVWCDVGFLFEIS